MRWHSLCLRKRSYDTHGISKMCKWLINVINIVSRKGISGSDKNYNLAEMFAFEWDIILFTLSPKFCAQLE